MPFPSSALFALLALTSWPALSQEVSLLIQRSTLAGYKYYEAREWAGALRPGVTLDLVREPDNPHDANAVRVEWHGRKLGYVPRARNAALAWAMDSGESVTARVAWDERPRRARRRVVFEILLR